MPGRAATASTSRLSCAPSTAFAHGRRYCARTSPASTSTPRSPAEMEDVGDIEALAGAADLLGSLPRDRWAIVTSASRELAHRRLAAAGLPLPPMLITAEDVECGKPAPDCFQLAALRLGVNVKDCLVFEDATAGIQAAEAAGAGVVVISTTHQHPMDTGHPMIDAYANVRAMVDAQGDLRIVALNNA
ncbi:HAD-IA family hydrolase [Ralstonia solanacearum]|uniref:HAD-IA family hydrolase n=1 Tax=Ralstonia solanacearum TaxID=305 RepID=UPI001CC27B18|nr:HAD-IA family hydrolase [Ralstonia solanacearum]